MDDFVSPEEHHVTKFHELIHATGHKKRLNRFKDDDPIMFGNEEYSFEELVAEM